MIKFEQTPMNENPPKITWMKTALNVAAIIFAVFSFLFPPADSYVYPWVIDGKKLGEDRLVSEGFTFIGEIGGGTVIRYPQWIIQLLVAGFIMHFTTNRKNA